VNEDNSGSKSQATEIADQLQFAQSGHSITLSSVSKFVGSFAN
jgi:hypothetical protein